MQDINGHATNIAPRASSYWAYRKNFIKLKYRPSCLKFPNAPQRAEMERVPENPLKASIPNSWPIADRCGQSPTQQFPTSTPTEGSGQTSAAANADELGRYSFCILSSPGLCRPERQTASNLIFDAGRQIRLAGKYRRRDCEECRGRKTTNCEAGHPALESLMRVKSDRS
jgi:hypothetical protein